MKHIFRWIYYIASALGLLISLMGLMLISIGVYASKLEFNLEKPVEQRVHPASSVSEAFDYLKYFMFGE